MLPVLVFDVNETLLDLRALDPRFEQVFGEARVRGLWFSQVLQLSLVSTLVGDYADFAALGRTALEMVAARRKRALSTDEQTFLLSGMRTLPAHPDVHPALERLKQSGFRMVTLTNNPPAVVQAQLQNAGLAEFFEQMLSVDAVRRFKPAAEVYQIAAQQLGVSVGECWLIAAHDWDVYGALRAGAHGAFIARPGMVLNGLMPQPEIVSVDLGGVADSLIKKFTGS
jgi:2-haloacid dehalogenase